MKKNGTTHEDASSMGMRLHTQTQFRKQKQQGGISSDLRVSSLSLQLWTCASQVKALLASFKHAQASAGVSRRVNNLKGIEIKSFPCI